ncbi:MAG: hypothetical protein ACOY3D_05550 [Candidatus Omnitrophota bacterium]
MLKKISAVFLAVLLLATSLALADVYVTKQGAKYHSQDCNLIAKRNAQPMKLEDAVAKGLTPCERCIGKGQAKNENEETVVATINGKRYHHPDCNLIAKRKTVSMSLSEAKAKGLEPCNRCFAQKDAEE